MEVLDIAFVHGWATVAKYLERTATSGNRELRLAIEDVKREEALGLKRTSRRSRSQGSPLAKRGSSTPVSSPPTPSTSAAIGAQSGLWMPPPMQNVHYNPYPPPPTVSRIRDAPHSNTTREDGRQLLPVRRTRPPYQGLPEKVGTDVRTVTLKKKMKEQFANQFR